MVAASGAPRHHAVPDRGRRQPSLGLSEVSGLDPELGARPQPRGAHGEVGSTQKAQSYYAISGGVLRLRPASA